AAQGGQHAGRPRTVSGGGLMMRSLSDWTHYLTVDPGHAAQAALFAAVPPPESGLGDVVLVYDEVFVERKDAGEFAAQIARKATRTRTIFQKFTMDPRAGRQTTYGASQ